MAERSFAKEVQDLKLGDGQEFHGEGILAITKALLQSGVGYVAGYQGAPISPTSPGTNSFSRCSLMNFTAAGQRISIFSFS